MSPKSFTSYPVASRPTVNAPSNWEGEFISRPKSQPVPTLKPVEVIASVPASVSTPRLIPVRSAVWLVEAMLFVAVKASMAMTFHASAVSTSSSWLNAGSM